MIVADMCTACNWMVSTHMDQSPLLPCHDEHGKFEHSVDFCKHQLARSLGLVHGIAKDDSVIQLKVLSLLSALARFGCICRWIRSGTSARYCFKALRRRRAGTIPLQANLSILTMIGLIEIVSQGRMRTVDPVVRRQQRIFGRITLRANLWIASTSGRVHHILSAKNYRPMWVVMNCK